MWLCWSKKDHPWYQKSYTDIEHEYPKLSIHGGLTYSDSALQGQNKEEELWYVGFDTAHFGDNQHNCDKSYCEQEVNNLKAFAESL